MSYLHDIFYLVQLKSLYDNESLISTELRILPDRLFIQANTDNNISKRQIASIQYSILAPVIFAANILNNTLVETVIRDIESINVFITDRNETLELNAVGMLNKL